MRCPIYWRGRCPTSVVMCRPVVADDNPWSRDQRAPVAAAAADTQYSSSSRYLSHKLRSDVTNYVCLAKTYNAEERIKNSKENQR